MDAMEKVLNEYRASLPQKRDTISIMLNSMLRDLDSEQKTGKLSSLDWGLFFGLLEKLSASADSYELTKLANHTKKLNVKLKDSKNYSSMPDLKKWISKWSIEFDEIISAETSKINLKGHNKKRSIA